MAHAVTIPCNLFPGIAVVDPGPIGRNFAQYVPDILQCESDAVLKKCKVVRERSGDSTSSEVNLVVELSKRPAEIIQSRDGQGNGLHMVLVKFPDGAEDFSNIQGPSGLLRE